MIDNDWYNQLGSAWWDPNGQAFLLHEMNPVRVGYFVQFLSGQNLEPFQTKVLDVGCGGGLVSQALAQAGFDVTGIDLSFSSVLTAHKHAQISQLTVKYLSGRAENLPFSDNAFDAVVSSDFLEHVGPNLDLVLTEMERVLKPGGLLLYDTINRTFLSRLLVIWGARLLSARIPPNTHIWPYLIKPEELIEKMRKVGFRNKDLQGLSPRLPFYLVPWYYIRHRKVGGFKLSKNLNLSYLGCGIKSRIE